MDKTEMQMRRAIPSAQPPAPQTWPAAQLVTKERQAAKPQEEMLLATMLL